MRLFLKCSLWFLLFFIFFLSSSQLKDFLRWTLDYWQNRTSTTSYFGKGVTSLAYESVEEADWIRFEIPPRRNSLRLVSNLLLPRNSTSPQEKIYYQIQYRLLDRSGDVIHSGSWYTRSELSLAQVDTLNFPVPAVQIRGRAVSVTDGRSTHLLLENYPNGVDTRYFEVRLASMAGDPTSGTIRLYYKDFNNEDRLDVAWSRTRASRKDRLNRGNAYPVAFLEPEEQQNLVKWEWRPLGPLGIADKDFHLTNLYVLRDFEEVEFEEGVLSYGLYTGPEKFAIIKLDENYPKLKLVLQPIGISPDEEVVNVKYNWYGEKAKDRISDTFSWAEGATANTISLNQGLLEIQTEKPMTLRLFESTPEGDIEITPRRPFIRVFSVNPESSVNYKLTPTTEAVVLRLDLRSIYEGSIPSAPIDLEVRTFGSNGSVYNDLILFETESAYDQILGEPQLGITDRQRRYLILPPMTESVEFQAESELFINVSQRPAKMNRLVELPDSEDGQRSWFMLRPNLDDNLSQEDSSKLVYSPPKPPQVEEAFITGDYDVDGYRPENDWFGRYMLLPQEIEEDTELISPSLFGTIRQNSKLEFTMPLLEDRSLVRPLLLYSNPRKSFQGEIRQGNNTIGRHTSTASLGEWLLPNLAENNDFILEWENADSLFINWGIGDSPFYRRRFYIRLPAGESLTYNIQDYRAGGSLIFRFVPGANDTDTTSVRASILNSNFKPGIQKDFTIPGRQYEILSESSSKIMPWFVSDKSPAGEQIGFYPLEADLGKIIKLKVENLSNNDVYFTLYQLDTSPEMEFEIRRGMDQ